MRLPGRVARGREIRVPVGGFNLAFGDYAIQGLSALRRRKDGELDDEATGAIEDTSDDPEATVQKKDTGDALRKCLGQLSAEHRRSSIPSTTTRSPWQKRLASLAFRRIP